MPLEEMVQAAIAATCEDQVWPDSLKISLPGNPFLMETVDRFLDARNRSYTVHPVPLWCFFETLPSDVRKLVRANSQHVSFNIALSGAGTKGR
jgi:hypothetical protein